VKNNTVLTGNVTISSNTSIGNVTASEIAVLDGLTASTAELNTLDGITASTAELNILDGVTASASELNVLDGITALTAELNVLDGITADVNELNILDGVTASASEINILDGATLSTTELNYVDGVTSAIQTQIDSKQATITGAATTIDTENLTVNVVLVSDSNGKVAVSSVTATELGYLGGATSNVQAQISGKANTSHTHVVSDITNLGTGVSTFLATPTYATTVTSGTSVTLTSASAMEQFFTGSTAQTVLMPVASTMTLGQKYIFHNNSSAVLTIQSSGANSIGSLTAGQTAQITCILTSGTTAASWDLDFTGATSATGSGSLVFGSAPTISSPTISTPALTLSTTTSNTAGRLARTDSTLRLGTGSAAVTFSDDSVVASTYAPIANATLTGTVVLPATTSIGDVSATEIGYVNNVTSSIQTQLDAKLALAGGTLTGALTLHADPTQALQAVTKQYVDSVEAGLKAKPSVVAATTANLTADYANGTSGVGATLTGTANGAFPQIDGVSVTTVNGQRGVLVKNQTNAAHNGRYNLTTQGDAGTKWVLTRCSLCDQASEIPGAYVFVTDGTLNGQTGWVQHVDDPATFVIGTDDIDVFQFAGSGTITAGNNITVVGNQVSVSNSPTFTGTVTLPANTAIGDVSSTEIGYVNGVTSAIQTQLNSKQVTITGAATTIDTEDLTVNRAVVSDGSGKIAVSSVTATEVGYLSGVTSGIQTQLSTLTSDVSGKQATITGGATSITTSNLTANVVVVSNATGKIAVSTVTITELGYLGGATSNVQAQINTKAPLNAPTFTNLVTVSATGIAFTDATQTKAGVPSITTISAKTDSYTLSSLDERDTIIEVSNATAKTVTIPTNTNVAYPVGTTIDIIQTGAGQVTIAGQGGVTVNATPGLKLRTQWSSATLLKRATNTWLVFGDLTA
jgi:hypothetical protein